MLNTLDIKNIALIEQLTFSVQSGMTVLTGETGAGKSIIIDALGLLLGARTNKELVRFGTEKAFIQGLFDLSDDVAAELRSPEIETEDNQIVLSREISADGKSVCRINGVITTLNVLREVGSYLINIHGQQDNQALLNPSKHIDFLDAYAKTNLETYTQLYHLRQETKNKLNKLSQNEQERMQRIDLLEYQINEIESARLQSGEKEDLLEQKKIIENAEKLALAVNEAYSLLYDDNSAYDSLSRAASALERISGIDSAVDDIYSKISSVIYAVEDSSHELRSYSENIEYDENILNDIMDRLDTVNGLERKYGGSIDAVLHYLQDASAELDGITHADETISLLQKELISIEDKLASESNRISHTRQKAAKQLQAEIEKALTDLDMPKVKFNVSIAPIDDFGIKGRDDVEFLISPNIGEPLKSLVLIASGGELSRVMLAIKSIIADNVDTLIFDEIDTGVSGSAAQKIAKKLSALGKNKQVICVSHQAQLAAAADNHFMIKKVSDGQRTRTTLSALNPDERINELARIIDGDNITETAIKHAKEMLKL